MAVLNREAISSNWKKLQEKLKTEDKPKKKKETATGSNGTAVGVKRKRKEGLDAPAKKSASSSRTESFAVPRNSPNKKRKTMGNYFSSSANGEHSTNSSLVRDHDIAPADLVAAYGTTQDSKSAASRRASTASDVINGGLHPTHKIGKYIALDCEMVGTGPPPDHSDNLLARVSVVNFHGEQIYDSYVQPPPGVRVDDYRTQWSGIRPSHLHPSTARPLATVLKDISELLEGRILVGHALRNDLAVLRISHPQRDMRDTSRYPKYRIASKGKAPALRNLAREELGLTIQTGEHSSLEDARATMQLFRKEKRGFEEENRKKFGQPRAKVKAGSKEKPAASRRGRSETPLSVDDDVDEDEADDDEEEDEEMMDFLTGEEDEFPAGHKTAVPAQGKAKKRKKKKRTKRK